MVFHLLGAFVQQDVGFAGLVVEKNEDGSGSEAIG
jgi:hypothetical protein